jgi:hypothetical protein
LLHPDAASLPYVRAAIARWEAAGVCHGLVRRTHDGAPVAMVYEPITRCGTEVGVFHGCTMYSSAGRVLAIAVYAGAPNVARTYMHELGHAIAPRDGHPESGVMATRSRDTKIDTASLEWICQMPGRCAFRRPEP